MRKYIYILLVLLIPVYSNAQFVQQQKKLDGNNIATYIINTGIFNQDISQVNQAGFEWPKGSGRFAIFSSGLTIAAKLTGQLRLATASYNGEYRPGYILNGVPQTDSRFHIFSIKRGDTTFTNTDYAEWGNMVPYGAPYVDVNNNGTFELGIDRPGVRDASQTIFICMTDGFPESHMFNEGFSGGTLPLFAEVHFTAWCYDIMGLEDVQFLKWDVINKSINPWEGAIFTIFADTDLGDATDDWIGCDSLIELGYTYNGDNNDSGNNYVAYGLNPPAAGISFLKTPKKSNNIEYGMSSFVTYKNSNGMPVCERQPDYPTQTYNYMKGLKSDGSKWRNALTGLQTKFIFSGDPESGAGWTEINGHIENCGNDTSSHVHPSPMGDRRMILNTSDSLYTLSAGNSVTIVASQQIAKGTNHLNSVTKLKQLTTTIKNFWQTIGITPISSEVPESFRLHQNYPNPFNPSTKIRFEIPLSVRGQKSEVRLYIYDIAGKEVARLVNEELQPGVYEYEFDGANLSSGMYFSRLETGDFFESRKMVLVK